MLNDRPHTHKNKLMSEQLYTQRHNRVCKVIRWHNCKNFAIPFQENWWEHEPKAITENMEVPLTYERMIPSSVSIENKALQPDIKLRYKKKEKKALLIEVLIPVILD